MIMSNISNCHILKKMFTIIQLIIYIKSSNNHFQH